MYEVKFSMRFTLFVPVLKRLNRYGPFIDITQNQVVVSTVVATFAQVTNHT